MNRERTAVFTDAQRYVALVYGLVTHGLFLASVVLMFWSLYNGLHTSVLRLQGGSAVALDLFLVLQFALGHTLLLSDKGRRFMARLAPLGLGRDLSTTIFAALASLQLLITFSFWSSSEVLWAAPSGWLKGVLSVLYGISWVLLAKSMRDAGLDLQLGSLGWRSVWKNERAVYQPFARTGLFRHSRQPIYLSFTLILWTAPVWTPDHLVIALLWTAYCLLAPLIKEKRYLRYYGAAFARYQQRVPYWFPRASRRMNDLPASHSNTDHDVAIVGAGPVGLLLAGLLGQRGFRVLIVDKRIDSPSHSQAIGITPPSLEILAQLGLDAEFIRWGVPIRDCHVHGQSGYLGCASFREIPGAYRYILSLPQQVNVRLLEEKLADYPQVTLRRGLEITAVDQAPDQVTLRGADFESTAKWVIGCDGHRSRVRDLLKMRFKSGQYPCHFIMGDFMDRSDLKDEAHLYFTAHGAVESFPLPEGKRRWIVQTPEAMPEAPAGYISAAIRERTGRDLPTEDQLNQSWFTPRWMECEQYHDGRVILCGDAAHLMSPIGGQGMNTGWADAEFIAEMLDAIEHRQQAATPLLEAYSRCRSRAARSATFRAACGMWLGTRTGPIQSWIRDGFMRHGLFKGPLAQRLGPHFAMLTIPYNTLKRVPLKFWRIVTA